MRKTFLVVGVWGVLIGWMACATPPVRPPASKDSFSRELRRELVGALQRRSAAVRSFRSFATVRYGSQLLGARGDTAIVVKAPHYLRIDSLSEFGLYDSQLVIADGGLTVYWAGENRYFRGLAGRDELDRYLRAALDPETAIQLLSGVVPLEDEEDYFLKERKGQEFLLRGNVGELVVGRHEGVPLPLRYTALGVDGSHDWTVTFSDYQVEGGHWFPHRLLARFRNPRSVIEVLFRSVELNVPLEKGLFEIKIPEDASPVE